MVAKDGMPTEENRRRAIFGHNFEWSGRLGFWYNSPIMGRMNPVLIFEPVEGNPLRSSWWVVSPNMGDFTEVSGEGAERRAFSIAAGYITQKK
jgi:hypothetical protein